MSYAAAQRQAEMGVRIALGASGDDVVSILVGSGRGWPRWSGQRARDCARGGPFDSVDCCTGSGRRTHSQLAAPCCLGVAALIPALRASPVDPALALREE